MDLDGFIKKAEEIISRVEAQIEKIDRFIDGSNVEYLVNTVKELRSVLHDAVELNGLYAQTQSALRNVAERIGQSNLNYENIQKTLGDNAENVRMMAMYFRIMADRLDDIIKCPLPEVKERRSHFGEPPPAGTSNESPKGG